MQLLSILSMAACQEWSGLQNRLDTCESDLLCRALRCTDPNGKRVARLSPAVLSMKELRRTGPGQVAQQRLSEPTMQGFAAERQTSGLQREVWEHRIVWHLCGDNENTKQSRYRPER